MVGILKMLDDWPRPENCWAQICSEKVLFSLTTLTQKNVTTSTIRKAIIRKINYSPITKTTTMILRVNSNYSASRLIISYTLLTLDPQLQNGGNRDNTTYTSWDYSSIWQSTWHMQYSGNMHTPSLFITWQWQRYWLYLPCLSWCMNL